MENCQNTDQNFIYWTNSSKKIRVVEWSFVLIKKASNFYSVLQK